MTDRKDCLALSLLILIILWFGGEMVWADKIPFFRDLGTYFYPMRFSLAESLKAGELPLWDRHVAMGYPLLADFQSGAFYPPHLVYLILPFFAAIRATFIFHYLVAAVGAYMLCRSWGYPLFLAIIGAILFTLGGAMVSLTNVLNHFQATVWLPWTILFAQRFLREQSWKNFLLMTLTLLFQFLAGSPEIYLMSQVLLLLYAVWFGVTETRIGAGKVFLLFLAANFLVAGLAMVQIMPTVELFAESRERQPLGFREAASWSLHPLSLFNLFFIDKEVNVENFTSPKPFFLRGTSFLVSHYLGAMVPIGLFLWFYYGSRKEKIVISAFVGASLLLAMGNTTPIYSFLFSYIPFFRIFRFPEKFFFLTYAALLCASLRGLASFLQSDDRWKRAILMPAFFGLLSALLYLYLRFDTSALTRFIAWATQSVAATTPTLAKSSLVLVHLEMQLALTFGILLLLFLGKMEKLRAALFKALLVAIVFIDLNSAHQTSQFLLSPDVVYKSPRILAMPDIEPNRLFYSPGSADVHPSYYVLPKEPSFAEFNSLVFSNLLPNTGVFFGFDYMQEIDALGRWPYITFLGVARKLDPRQLYHLLGSLNVQYISSFSALEEVGITLVRSSREYPSWLYKVDHVVPRVYVVSKSTEEKEPQKVLRRLASVEFDPLSEVILEEALPLPSKADLHASANIVRYANRAVDIDAALDRPGILVLADSFYPGWRAYVDGKEAKILRANLFFRAVSLPPGKHRVEFRYKPVSFTIGLVISMLTLCGIVAWSLILFMLKKKASTPPRQDPSWNPLC